jgi:hypothetical protein
MPADHRQEKLNPVCSRRDDDVLGLAMALHVLEQLDQLWSGRAPTGSALRIQGQALDLVPGHGAP